MAQISKIQTIIGTIQVTPDCIVDPAVGLPVVEQPHGLPRDLLDFYKLCGGVTLFESSAYSARIVSPQEIVLANPVIMLGLTEEEIILNTGEISWSWYIIGDLGNGDYITIDFDLSKLGRCYQSFWDSYPLEGDSPIIATSFTDLLIRLLANKGQHWYWLRPDSGFEDLGDAYD